MKKALKTTFLYIGTAIGAGFSSGREIALFFGESSPVNVAVSSVFMSALCALFLIAGKQNLIPKGKAISLCIFLSASISLCAMLAGGDFIMYSMTGIPVFLGLAMTILGGIIVVLGIEKIKIVNSILVPLIVLSIALIFAKLPTPSHSLAFSISKPILYSGLDVLLGGVIISEEGKNLSYKEIALSCVLTCGFMFGMLYMLQTIVLTDTNNSLMPVLAISQQVNLKAICGVLIATAIFTTLVSSLKIVSDNLQTFLSNRKSIHALGEEKNKSLIVFFCLLVAYPLSFFGFDNIVDTLYPFISACGVLFTVIVILKFILKGINDCRAKHSKPPLFEKFAIRKSKNKQHRLTDGDAVATIGNETDMSEIDNIRTRKKRVESNKKRRCDSITERKNSIDRRRTKRRPSCKKSCKREYAFD